MHSLFKYDGRYNRNDLKKAFRFNDDCQSKSKYRMAIRIKFETEIMWPCPLITKQRL
jgi:hypothetical protein